VSGIGRAEAPGVQDLWPHWSEVLEENRRLQNRLSKSRTLHKRRLKRQLRSVMRKRDRGVHHGGKSETPCSGRLRCLHNPQTEDRLVLQEVWPDVEHTVNPLQCNMQAFGVAQIADRDLSCPLARTVSAFAGSRRNARTATLRRPSSGTTIPAKRPDAPITRIVGLVPVIVLHLQQRS